MKRIIDISKYNTVNFKQLKVDAVIIRAGSGRKGIDPKFAEHINSAIAAGLPIGIYFFSYAYTEAMAREEAKKCLEYIRPYQKNIMLPVFFDWEYDSADWAKRNGVTPTKKFVTRLTKVFCDEIRKAGYKTGFYYNEDYRRHYYDLDALKGFYRWYARYTSAKQTDCDIWQYTEDGRIAGAEGSVDLNYLVNEELLPEHRKKTVTALAKEVIAGKWGNGAERKRRLTEAGYDYDKVQAKVNAMLK